MTRLTGGCVCGGVRYVVAGELQPLIACHCKQCQRMSGSFFVATAVARTEFELETGETLRWHDSSPTSRRGFCSRCGSSLFFDHGPDEPIGISAGSLDEYANVELAAHIYCDEANPQMLPGDGTPRFTAAEWRAGGWRRLRPARGA